MGNFYWLFSLLEDEVHILDFQAAVLITPPTNSQTSFAKYSNSLQQLRTLREERGRVELKANLYDQLCTTTAVSAAQNSALLQAMLQEAAKLRAKITEIVKSLANYLWPNDDLYNRTTQYGKWRTQLRKSL